MSSELGSECLDESSNTKSAIPGPLLVRTTHSVCKFMITLWPIAPSSQQYRASRGPSEWVGQSLPLR